MSLRRTLIVMLVAGPGIITCANGVIDLLPLGSTDAGTEGGLSEASSPIPIPPDALAEDCGNGQCPCGLSPCNGSCVDLQNDPNNCGGCATPIAHYHFCQNGRGTCLPGFTPCGSACMDVSSNPDNCGACGAAPCASGEKCENGVCGSGTCGVGLTGCPFAGNRVACVDLSKGEPFCGDCNTVCGPDQVCVSGHCQPYAPATPCNACPCAADCTRTEGAPSSCCPGLWGNGLPMCVHGTGCP
jgi:hypothetical protein